MSEDNTIIFSEKELLIGVDIHRRNNVVSMIDGCGRTIGNKTYRNDRSGTNRLTEDVCKTVKEKEITAVHVTGEATGIYWFPFFCQLERAEVGVPLTLYLFNPKLTAGYRKVMGEMNKTDEVDAASIAGRLRIGKGIPRPFQTEEQLYPLRLLTRQRFQLMQELSKAKTRTQSLLYMKGTTWSLQEKAPFSNALGATSRKVMKAFETLDDIKEMPLDDLSEWLDDASRHRLGSPMSSAQKLHQMADDSYRLPDDVAAAVHQSLTVALSHIAGIERNIKQLDRLIKTRLDDIPHSLTTIPGIGDVLAAGIISEIGNVARFDYDEARVAGFAGFKWRKHQSGDFTADHTPLTNHRNRYLRYYLCQAAQLVRVHAPAYRAHYDKKYREARSHHHKRALVLTARKLIRLIVRLLTTNEPYRLDRVNPA